MTNPLLRLSHLLSVLALAGLALTGCAADETDLEDDESGEEVGQSADEIRACRGPLTLSCSAGSSLCTRAFAESRCAAYGSVRSVTKIAGGYRCTYYCPVNGR